MIEQRQVWINLSVSPTWGVLAQEVVEVIAPSGWKPRAKFEDQYLRSRDGRYLYLNAVHYWTMPDLDLLTDDYSLATII